MKIRGIILIGFAFFFFSSATGWGAGWRFYALTWQGTNYYDTATMKWLSKNVVRVWVKNVPSPNGKEWVKRKYSNSEMGKLYGEVSYDINLFEINCASRIIRITEGTSYNMGGTPVMSSDQPTDWQHIVPGSTNDSLFESICKKKSQK